MNQKPTIAGLEFEIKFCKKVNEKPLQNWEISRIPLANIYNSSKSDTYTVNIFAYIPTDFTVTKEPNQSLIDLMPEEENKLFFSYNGVCAVKTSMSSIEESKLTLCRNFSIEYDASGAEPIEYNLYHIQLYYRIVVNHAQRVAAIIVHDKNFDPVTSRGTVTTVRTDNDL